MEQGRDGVVWLSSGLRVETGLGGMGLRLRRRNIECRVINLRESLSYSLALRVPRFRMARRYA
jgi:hypothetical protein